MKYTSILEKMQCLLGLVNSSIVYMTFLGMIVILLSLFLTKRLKRNKFIVMMVVLYLSLFTFVILNNYKSLSSVFDSIMTNLFTNIYFPSAYVYLFIIVVIDISMLVSLLNVKIDKIFKIINNVVYGMMQFILVIIMDIIANNDIDIFSKTSLFTNSKLVMMLELSVNIFIIWLIVLGGIFAINSITNKVLSRETEKELLHNSVVMNKTDLEVNVNANEIAASYLYDEQTVTKASLVPENTIDNNVFNLNDLVQKSINVAPIKDSLIQLEENGSQEENKMVGARDTANDVFDMIINNTLPVIKEEKKKKIEKDITNYTLNDYKIFNKMLREVKMYNIGSIVNIDKVMELRLLDKFSKEEYNLFKKMLKSYSN